MRTPDKRKDHSYEGLAAAAYLRCDEAHTLRDLARLNHVHEEEIVPVLEEFVRSGLMINSGDRYLSLAVVRDAGAGNVSP
jgi:hypothetical protein